MTDPANDNDGLKAHSPRPCPICRKPSVEKYHPFCSKRCADVDLARWLGGNYAIPVKPTDEDDDQDDPPEGGGPRRGSLL